MLEKCEIVREVQKGLNNLKVAKDETNKVWTRKVKTELCRIGQSLGCSVYASGVGKPYQSGGEWRYDVTWLEYECKGDPWRRSVLSNAHLAAECEWGGPGEICDDFEKLLLARARVRVMIFDGDHFNLADGSSKEFARQLAKRVEEFEGQPDKPDKCDWLLAAWERKKPPTNSDDWWRFRYFTIDRDDFLELT